MMFDSTVSRRGNKCVQVYTTYFGWAREFTMLSHGDPQDLFSQFARDGVPHVCMCNNAKEMIKGKNHQNELKNTAYHLKQFEPYTHWSNAAEKKSKSLRKELVVSYCVQGHLSACGMRGKPRLGLILPITFLSLTGRYPEW